MIQAKHRGSMALIFPALILLMVFNPALSRAVELNQWLILGPADIPAAERELLKNDTTLLQFEHLPIPLLSPSPGQPAAWRPNRALSWQKGPTPELNAPDSQLYYLAVYLQPSRWLQSELSVIDEKDELPIAAFLDGAPLTLSPKNGKKQTTLDLTHEKHLLILKLIAPKQKKLPLRISLENLEPFKNDAITLSHHPKTVMKIEHVLNAISVSGVQLSPDGRLAAISLQHTPQTTGKIQSWIEILNTATGKTILSSQHLGTWDDLKWLKESTSFTFIASGDAKSSVIHYDLNTHRQQILLQDIPSLSSHQWAPDNSFMIFSISHEPKDDAGYRYMRELTDRNKIRDPRYSWRIYCPQPGAPGTNRGISSEEQNFNTAVISPDSKKILFFGSENDYKQRPYSKTSLNIMDADTLALKKITGLYFMQNAVWTSDSRKLIITGGPSLFSGVGLNLPKDLIPNEYDSQAYLFDPETGKAEALSRDFDPSISEILHTSGKEFWVLGEDKTFVRLYRGDIAAKSYKMLDASVDVIRVTDIAENRSTAVYWGSSATTPFKLYKINLPSGKGQLLKDYNRELFENIELGTIENWNYKSSKDRIVNGLIYLPPNFDRNKKYPCIVYYYGGTSPVERSFSGRYPFNWYAAHGYVVYVLQPTGTIGYGQASSAVHVNDWGGVTSDDIIGAVKELVKTHPFIDPEHIGAMGASYGGFLTQYLAARNEVFAAYISHAGITSLASYWGVGDWGYSYSAFASADSFPWNRKDLYVGHSPLFMAERIQKPLLLLHGDADNNVPPGESYQMFAALKILGKDAALITYKDQAHFISDYNKRRHWMRSIMAWWEKYLKNKPEQWEFMFKKQ